MVFKKKGWNPKATKLSEPATSNSNSNQHSEDDRRASTSAFTDTKLSDNFAVEGLQESDQQSPLFTSTTLLDDISPNQHFEDDRRASTSAFTDTKLSDNFAVEGLQESDQQSPLFTSTTLLDDISPNQRSEDYLQASVLAFTDTKLSDNFAVEGLQESDQQSPLFTSTTLLHDISPNQRSEDNLQASVLAFTDTKLSDSFAVERLQAGDHVDDVSSNRRSDDEDKLIISTGDLTGLSPATPSFTTRIQRHLSNGSNKHKSSGCVFISSDLTTPILACGNLKKRLRLFDKAETPMSPRVRFSEVNINITPRCYSRRGDDVRSQMDNRGSSSGLIISPRCHPSTGDLAGMSTNTQSQVSKRLQYDTPLSTPSDVAALDLDAGTPCRKELEQSECSPCIISNMPQRQPSFLSQLSKYQIASFNFVAKSEKRRKKRPLSGSGKKKQKRTTSKKSYVKHGDEVKEAGRVRYMTSPRFVQRILKRVQSNNLYYVSRSYRQSTVQRASQVVKEKYKSQSPYRRDVIKSAKSRYSKIQTVKSKLSRLRKAQRRRSRRHAEKRSELRKVRYEQPVYREKCIESAKSFKRKAKTMNNQENTIQDDCKNTDRKRLFLIKRKKAMLKRGTGPFLPAIARNTAEYRKNRFKAWFRFKVNQMFAHCSKGLIAGEEDKHKQLHVKKLEISHLLHYVLGVQRSRRSQLYQVCAKINKLYDTGEEDIQNMSNEEKEAHLTEYYGGERYHVPGQKLFGSPPSLFTYKPYLEVFPERRDACTKHQQRITVASCIDVCKDQIPSQWALHLHKSLFLFNSHMGIQKLLYNAYLVEKCSSCDAMQGLCASANDCSDLIRYLLNLQVHFTGLRTLLRLIYEFRKYALDLHVIELLLQGGRYDDLFTFKKEISDQTKIIVSEDSRTRERVSDDCLLQQFGHLNSAFRDTVKNSMEVHECNNCLRLYGRSKIKTFGLSDAFCTKRNDIKYLIDAYQNHFGSLQDGINLCKACLDCFKKKQLSPFSFQNKMWPTPIPSQLKRLNAYERQIVSLSKSFQRIVKLSPYNYRGSDTTLVRAVKGLAIYLPLPSGTVSKVSDVLKQEVMLPDCSNFLIQVDSLPKLSKKLVFRSLVDVTSVVEALAWLKDNNPLYSNVIVDPSFILLKDESKLPRITYTSTGDEDNIETIMDPICPVQIPVSENDDRTDVSSATLESKLVVSKRKVKKRPTSFFDSGDNHPDSSTVIEDEVQPNQTTRMSTEIGSTHTGGSASRTLISDLKFPIPYVVPYKKYWLDQLKDTSSMLMHLPLDDILEEFSIIQMETSLPKVDDLELFAMKPLMSTPLYWDDPKVDVASFPILFPDGVNGIFQERNHTVTPAFYTEHRMRMSDPRFRRDQTYLFDCAIRRDMMSINSSVYTMLNVGKFGRVTAAQIRKGAKEPDKSSMLEKNVCTMMGQIVGTPQYWRKVRYDLEAVVETYGSATFFFTASCGEYRLEDFREFLILRNIDLPNVHNTSIRNLISIDPVSVSLHFHKKFTAFWEEVIMKDDGPLGCVEHYYIRKEYQQRGAPHMHVLLWIKNAPVHGRDKDEDVLKFICDHITCSLPDPIKSPVLHNLVTRNQTHCCTKSCLRTKTVKGKFYCSFCRYGFPRKVSDSAELNSVESVLQAKVTGRGRKKLYALPRKASEITINDYNPALLWMWEANIDVQYIMDAKQCLVYYTTVYVCKTEKQLMSKVAETVNTSLSTAGMAKQFACKLLSSRQLGAYEAADKALRHPLYQMSECVKFASLYLPGEQRRRLKTKKDIDTLSSDSTDVFCKNFQDSYYPGRPPALEKLSAYEVLRSYDVKYGKPALKQALYMPKLNAYFSKRRKEAVIRIYKLHGEDSFALERYCFQILALFQPWRSYNDLLKDDDGNAYSTYMDAYNAIRSTLPDLQQYEGARNRLREMIEWAEHIQKSAQDKLEAELASGVHKGIRDSAGDSIPDLDIELCQQSKKIRSTLTEVSVKENYQKLNAAQKEVFRMIVDHIDQSKDVRPDDSSKRVFVSGVGGTGKSFLIMTLRHHLEYYYSSDAGTAVLTAAPTGVAAANIDGVTIHKLLKLPVSKSTDSSQAYWSLHPQDVKILRMLFKNVKLLIIDEISMLSNLYLLFIHKRLNDVLVEEGKDPYARFGNLNILLLGDLLQLPPVNAPYIFQSVTRKQIEGSFKSLGGTMPLWTLFEFAELTENMRQRDDAVYAQMLDRIRIGSPTEDDLVKLRTRLIVQDKEDTVDWNTLLHTAVDSFLDMLQHDMLALCLMPKNDDVSAFNKQVMEVLQLQTVICKAEDLISAALSSRSRKRTNKKQKGRSSSAVEDCSSKLLTTAMTGGLENELTLAVGARVMLRRNIDVELKLVNGSIGYVRRIDVNPTSGVPEVIQVQFADVPHLTPVTRIKVQYSIGVGLFIERSQFPLNLAYAITIHKCQGLSLDNAMVDLGSGLFSDGMGYVALSRVRRLANLHLIRFCGSRLTCDRRSIKEYGRLRGFEITGYNLNPEFSPHKSKVLITAKTQKSMLREESEMESNVFAVCQRLQERKSNALETGRKRGDQASLPPLESGMYLKFNNTDGHACFSNVILQCLLRCSESHIVLQEHSSGIPVAEALVYYIQRQNARDDNCLSSDSLREVFGSDSQFAPASAINCDPADFLIDLLQGMPVQYADQFIHYKSIVGRCPNEACLSENIVQVATDQFIDVAVDIDINRYILKELFPEDTTRIHRCTVCRNLCVDFPVKIQYVFPVQHRYLVLNTPVLVGDRLIDKALLGLRERNLSLFGEKWNIIACVQMSGATVACESDQVTEFRTEDDPYRHYLAYVQHIDKCWIQLSDTNQLLLKQKPIFKHMVLIFLERLHV